MERRGGGRKGGDQELKKEGENVKTLKKLNKEEGEGKGRRKKKITVNKYSIISNGFAPNKTPLESNLSPLEKKEKGK